MTDTVLAPDSGSLARIAVRLVLLAAAVAGLTIGDGNVVLIQAGLEVILIVATAARTQPLSKIPVARVARAIARPVAVLLVLTRWHSTEADLLAVIAGAEILVEGVRQWWRATKRGGAA